MKKVLFLIFAVSTFASTLEEKLVEKKSGSKAPPEIKKIMMESLKSLKDSGIEKKALGVGTMAPDFLLDDKKFSDLHKDGSVVVKFFRGSWCPYCQIELKEYRELNQKFVDKKCRLIVISPDSKMENLKTKNKLELPFEVYTDTDNTIAKKFGIAFKVEENLNKIYKNFGIDLDQSQGNEKRELPLPGTYVVNKKGKITYAFIDADYTKRAEPTDVLKACN